MNPTSAPIACSILLVLAGPALAAAAPGELADAIWQVTTIDGKPVETRPGGDGARHEPGFTFGARSYGGNVGCNALGGLFAQVDGRLYTMPGSQTQMGCGGAVGEQEKAANAILGASPRVERGAAGVVLVGGGHRMELKRRGDAGKVDPPTAWQAAGVAAQAYTVHAVNGRATDGRRLWGRRPPQLRFGSTSMTMLLDCPTPVRGSFAPAGDRLVVSGLAAPCRSPGSRDRDLAAILAAGPRTVSGPNGELLLASPAGWAILWNDSRDRPK